MAGIGDDEEIYDATQKPNVVDPDVFFDKEGRLWMIYCSYSGGIFIMELDVNTGFPLPDQGYGKKLLGANHARIEAPYMQTIDKYSKEQITGEYKYVNHNKEITADIVQSELIQLTKSGKIKGAVKGKWKLIDDPLQSLLLTVLLIKVCS